MPNIDLSILNQRQTPAFYADVFANRPAAGYVGRIFVSTDTFAFYRDNGTGWDLIGGPGTGTITGSGTAGTVPLWNGASTIGNSTLLEGTTKFTTTKDFQADGYYLTGMTAGSGALYYTSDRVTLANYNPTGTVEIEVAGGTAAQTINADLSTRFYGNIIRNGGTSSQFLKADGSLDSNTYNTGSGAASQVAFFSGTNSISGENNLWWDSTNNHFGINTNTPGTAADIHHNQSTILQLNQTTATNDTRIAFQNSGTSLWRIGAFYNAGANDFGIYDAVAAIQPVTVKKTTGQVLIGTSTVGSGKLVVASATGDNGIQIVGATAPSLRIDSAESGPTKRAGLGISTATNNFIQGSADRDFCIFNGSTAAASPILFGIYDAAAVNVQEAARISPARNFLIGTTTDAGQKLQVSGTALISGNTTVGVAAATTNVELNLNGVSGKAQRIQFKNSGTDQWLLGPGAASETSAFELYNASGTIVLSINKSTNAATFSSSVSSGGYLANGSTTIGMPVDTGGTKAYFDASSINGPALTLRADSVGRTIRMTSDAIGTVVGAIDSNSSGLNIGTNSSSPIIFKPQASEAMRLVPGGNLLIGTTTDAGQKLQVNGSASINGLITQGGGIYGATGQFSLGGGATGTFYTFSNTSANQVYLVSVRQAGGGSNNVVGMVFIYAGNVSGYNIAQDNTNPALYLTISMSGLNLQLTTGAGYGTTTWDYTITIIK